MTPGVIFFIVFLLFLVKPLYGTGSNTLFHFTVIAVLAVAKSS